MKRIWIAVGVAAGVVILGIVAILVLANPNRYRATIQTQLEKQLGRKVSLGEMSLGLLPLRFQVSNPVIAEDPLIRPQPDFIRAENLDIRIGLLALLQGAIRVDSLELRRPRIELVATPQGQWNFASLGTGEAGATNNAGATPPSTGSSSSLSINRLTIVDGQVGITDLRKGPSRSGYDHIDLTILDYSPAKPFLFDLVAHVQGDSAQEVRLKGSAGPTGAGAATPFHGTLNLKQVQIDGFMKFLDTGSAPAAKGILSGESEIASQTGNITSNGKFKLDGGRFNSVDIGYPIGLDYKLSVRTSDSLMTISSATLQLGQTPLSLAGSIDPSAMPAAVDLRIKSGDAPIAEIARLASAFGVAFAPGAKVDGRVSVDVRAKGPTSKPAVTGKVAGRDLKISGQGIAQPVEVQAIDLALSPTTIQSNEFNATTGKTTVTGQFSLLQYASNSPSIDLGLRAPGATLPEIQSIARAYGVTSLDQINGAGTLNFDLRAKGPLQSLNAAEAARALNGTINLDFSPLKVAGFDTVYELTKLAGFGSNTAEQSSTDIVRVIGQVLVKNGIAETSNLRAQLASGQMTAAGTADLATESLNLKLATIFSKEFTDKIGATRAGGVMNAAFTNNTGELVLPAIVTGTFKKPKFAPDLKAVVELQKQRFLPNKENAADAVSKALGALTGKKDDTQKQDQPAEKKPSGLKGILDALGGKK